MSLALRYYSTEKLERMKKCAWSNYILKGRDEHFLQRFYEICEEIKRRNENGN